MNITRFHNLEKKAVSIEFLTPTYLGGADQQTEVRTPPFKSLLRQWWRVANGHLNPRELFEQEGQLFGRADKVSTASLLRLNIVEKKVTQPDRHLSGFTYLGFGRHEKEAANLKYLEPGSQMTLELLFPKAEHKAISTTLQLIQAYGTIGSRSRNGFGSLHLDGISPLYRANTTIHHFEDTLQRNVAYPHWASDQYVWSFSRPFNDWRQAMGQLQETYKTLRSSFSLKGTPPSDRHLLGYPLHQFKVPNWGERMPSQLRLMVKKDQQSLRAQIAHIPHALSNPGMSVERQLKLWKKVHQHLDENRSLRRLS